MNSRPRSACWKPLAREPGHAQGWMNLAALERLSARQAQSRAA